MTWWRKYAKEEQLKIIKDILKNQEYLSSLGTGKGNTATDKMWHDKQELLEKELKCLS